MRATLAAVILLAVIVGLIVAAARIWRRRAQGGEVDGGVDIIPYLLLALAVGTAGFTLAALARSSLTGNQLAGRPTGEIAGALAGLVVSAPIAFLLWRRQAARRKIYPEAAGWPVYLTLIELAFLAAFFFSVWDLAGAIFGEGAGANWTDLLVYGGIVAFNWWSERREPARGDARDLPRLTGSGVALIALAIGLIGSLTWLLSLAYDGIWGLDNVPEPATPLTLLFVAGPIWAYRWLPPWEDDPGSLRNFYLGLTTTVTLTMVIGALLTVVVMVITFFFGERPAPASDHFSDLPVTLAVLLGAGPLWWHHVRRLARERTGARRGYEYAMAAVGLATLVGSSVALVEAAFTPTLAGTDNAATLLTLGCIVITAGWVWLYFWRRAQRASPRQQEVRALPRRFYLVGMAIVLGLTAAGSLIAVLVIVFRALLGEVDGMGGNLRLPVALTLVSGLATWHLVDQLRDDRAGTAATTVKPFSVTVICSHPGNLGAMFPREARVRVIYRDDNLAVIDEDMASAIVTAIDGRSSFVWVDQDGFRIAPARER